MPKSSIFGIAMIDNGDQNPAPRKWWPVHPRYVHGRKLPTCVAEMRCLFITRHRNDSASAPGPALHGVSLAIVDAADGERLATATRDDPGSTPASSAAHAGNAKTAGMIATAIASEISKHECLIILVHPRETTTISRAQTSG